MEYENQNFKLRNFNYIYSYLRSSCGSLLEKQWPELIIYYFFLSELGACASVFYKFNFISFYCKFHTFFKQYVKLLQVGTLINLNYSLQRHYSIDFPIEHDTVIQTHAYKEHK